MKMKHYAEMTKSTAKACGEIFRRYRNTGFKPSYLEGLLLPKLYEKPEDISFKKFGTKNVDKFFCIIRLHPEWIPTAGFFALFNRTLGALYYADYYSLIPIIDNWNYSAYEENEKINGSYNVFEYYFNPVSNFSLVDALQSRNVMILKDINADLILGEAEVPNWYTPTPKYISALAKIYKKYISFNNQTEELLQKDIKELGLRGKVLGVHYRGTDYKLGAANHPSAYSLEKYGMLIEKYYNEKKFDSIFLATDDLEAIQYFKNKFPNIKFYKDVLRSEGKVSVAFIENRRKNNNYRLGYEVLRDMYTLALCNGFIGGQSQVSLTARVYKESKDEKFDVLHVVKTEIKQSGIDWMDYFKQNLKGKK